MPTAVPTPGATVVPTIPLTFAAATPAATAPPIPPTTDPAKEAMLFVYCAPEIFRETSLYVSGTEKTTIVTTAESALLLAIRARLFVAAAPAICVLCPEITRSPLAMVRVADELSLPTSCSLGAARDLAKLVRAICEISMCWAKESPKTWTPAATPDWTARPTSLVWFHARKAVVTKVMPIAQEQVMTPVEASYLRESMLPALVRFFAWAYVRRPS